MSCFCSAGLRACKASVCVTVGPAGVEVHLAASIQPDPAAIDAEKMPTISAKNLNKDRWDGGPGASYTMRGAEWKLLSVQLRYNIIVFVLWWLAEEVQQFARRTRALGFGRWWRGRRANLLS
jgi:hypothetical protein